jgi:hypothetical protein
MYANGSSYGPHFRSIRWSDIEAVARLRGPARSAEKDNTVFRRYPAGHIESPAMFSHLIYDTYVPDTTMEIGLHCRGCKTGKRVTVRVPPGVVQPAIAEYTCAKCTPRKTRREDVLSKRHPLAYGSYRAMTGRCTSPSHSSYKDYGGRGIKICPRWTGKHGFANFLADMGDRTAELSIDRIDVNGNYTPQNCRWATAKQQCLNKRNSAEDLESLKNFENELLEEQF